MRRTTLKDTYTEYACPICQSHDKSTLYPDTLNGEKPSIGYGFSADHTKTYQIVRCLKCTHCYCTPRDQNIDAFYKDAIDPKYLSREKDHFLTAQKTLKIIQRFKTRGKLLDIGCATGDFMFCAQTHFECEGLELCEWSRKKAQEKGFIVHSENLESLNDSNAYDIITLWGVIEHFEFPRDELKKIHRLLKPGGIVCLWTGNIDGTGRFILRRKWWHFLSQHIQFFNKKSLNHLFTQFNFKQLYCGLYPYVMSSNSIADSLGRYPRFQNVFKKALRYLNIKNNYITLKIPGELFQIYQKQ